MADELVGPAAAGPRRLRRGLRVRLHPGHGERILALPEPAWATTWMHQANEMIAPAVGLPGDLPVIEFTQLFTKDPDGLYWKTRQIATWAAGRPFAWVDDLVTDLDVRHVEEHDDAVRRSSSRWTRAGACAKTDFKGTLEQWAHSL
ncbi:hypothetical protein ACRAWF_31890 [Streptomyces sp. L7]